MLSPRTMLTGLFAASMTLPSLPSLAEDAPSAGQILRKLEAAPQVEIAPEDRMSIQQLKRRPQMRRIAPSIDIQGINFEFGSAAIPRSERREVENIAIAVNTLIDRNPEEVILIEGHTDAVGSGASNLALSDRRAETVAKALTEYFDVPPENLVVQGYGETDLRIETEGDERANRRAAVRIITPLLSIAAAN